MARYCLTRGNFSLETEFKVMSVFGTFRPVEGVQSGSYEI